VASNSPGQAANQGQCSCQVIWLRPLRAGRAAIWMSSVRMVAPRALAWRVEARVPQARVGACAVTAGCGQGGVGVERGGGQVGQRSVDEVGEDLLDDGVPAMLGFGLHERERAIGEHRVIPIRGEQLALALRGGVGVEACDAPHDQPAVGAVRCGAVRCARAEANAV
jgi:hypothetical protein